jgi:hypothetical protein
MARSKVVGRRCLRPPQGDRRMTRPNIMRSACLALSIGLGASHAKAQDCLGFEGDYAFHVHKTSWSVKLKPSQSLRAKSTVAFTGNNDQNDKTGLVFDGSFPVRTKSQEALPPGKFVKGKAQVRFSNSKSLTVPVSFNRDDSGSVRFNSLESSDSYNRAYYVPSSRLESLLGSAALDISLEYKGSQVHYFPQFLNGARKAISEARALIEACGKSPKS